MNKQRIMSFDEIEAITSGFVRTEKTENGIEFCRFTAKQEEYYRYSERFFDRAKCSAGIMMRFETFSKSLTVKAVIFKKSLSPDFVFDIFVNGKYFDCMTDSAFGEFQKSFDLPSGLKQIEIHFPYNQMAVIKEILIDDGATAKPLKYGKKALMYGDSISQGFSCFHPSKRFAGNICRYLEAEEINKSVAGQAFRAKFAEFIDTVNPSYIFVAYGTNEWNSNRMREDIEKECNGFCLNLRKNYPQVPIYLITPVWRKDADEVRLSGSFDGLKSILKTAVKDIPDISVISGDNLIPHDVSMFSDLKLHPNDSGFTYYSENLIEKIKNN